ncbi:MAG: bifunctional oligoribonuclease/PAP phosphatase NrnA [Chloroflexota bacterium]|nr:bifunctional oligoribonuclease/PAP phosphatase NrnA [Chloroflexota bacterium]
MKLDPQVLTAAMELLRASQRPLLLTHPRPDGDTIGCALALRLALQHLGKEPQIACPHPIPTTMAYLPGAAEFRTEVPADADIDLVVVVDMSDLKRTGGLYNESWRGRIPLLVIDHHETNDGFGDVSLIAPQAAATALPMLALIRALGVPVGSDIATCLLLATLTDTRGLRTESTTPEVLSMVAELIEAGGDYLGIMQKTLDSVPYQQMRGWGVALNRLQLAGRVAWITFPLAEKEALGIEDHDDLALGNLISRVAEADISVTFLEMRDGSVKISFRARPGYNVAQIAKGLGGGGHRQAAGCSVAGPLETVPARVLPLVRAVLAANGRQP